MAFADRGLHVSDIVTQMLVDGYVQAMYNWDRELSLPIVTLEVKANLGTNIAQALRESIATAPAKIDGDFHPYTEMVVAIEGDQLRIYQKKPEYPHIEK
jgi:hypothetical protein